MSTTVDQRVVEMRFDNKNFENNIAHTMSTLEKFKQKLRLDGATKGLENINTATRKVDISGLGKSVEAVQAKFSALQVMGVTALANITNSAINAGKRMVSALTIEPVKDGFSEYEMTLNAIQTTMAATGKTSKEVEKQLKSLDEYADKTVYSTADMLNNLPKFTNAGVDLEKATKAMIGIANATALAGGDAGKASIAFYNLGQAIGTGYLTRMDYNSINNAGIATMEWKNQMVEAAIAQGTLTKVGEDAYKAGKKTFTLQQLFIDGLQEQWATTDVMMKVFGDYGDETTEIGKKSYAAAQDIKTFSMMMDSLKATAGTGWKDTWQLIFGDLEQAKVLWTGLTNFISNIITKFADFRNSLLEGALGKTFSSLSKKIQGVLTPAKKAADVAKKVTGSVEDLGEIVNKVIRGDFGDGAERMDALTKAGQNYYRIQNKVNETLGNTFRYTDKQIEAQDKLLGTQKQTTDAKGKEAEATTKLTKADKDRIKQVAKLTEAEAKALGYTDEQIEAFRELGDVAKKLGMPLDEFIDKMDEIDGRWLLIESFKNVGKSIITVFKSIGKAWANVFPPKTMEQRADKLFDLIAALHKFTRSLIPTEAAADNLRRVFEGLFAALDIVRMLTMGPLTIAFKAVKAILGAFNIDILEGVAYIGDMVVKFRNWLKSVLDFNGAFEKLAGLFKKFIEPVKEFFSKIDYTNLSTVTESVKEFIDSLNVKESVADNFKKIIEGLRAAFELGKTLWSMSLVAGLKILSAVLSLFGTDLVELGGKIADWIVGIRDGVKEHTIFIGYVDKLAKIIHTLISGIEKCVKAFLKLEPVQKVINGVKDAFKGLLGGIDKLNIDGFVNGLKKSIDKVVAWIEGLKDSENIGRDLIQGIINGITKTITNLVNILTNLGKTIIDTICGVLGIESPAKEGISIGENVILGIIEGLLSMITSLGKAIKNIALSLLDSLKETGASMMSAVLWGISSIFTSNPIWNIGAAMFGIFAAMGGDTAKGFINGASSSFGKVIECISNLASNVINAFKKMLGIHSPSTVFIALGKFVIAGLILGIVGQKTGLFSAMSNVFGGAISFVKDIFSKGLEWIQNLPPIKWEYILGIGVLVGAIVAIKKVFDIFENFSKAAKGVGKMCSGIGNVMDALANKLDPQKSKFQSFADTMLKVSISIAILAASVWVLSKVDGKSLLTAVGAVAALAAVIAILAVAFNKLGKTMTIDVDKISGLILSVAVSMLLLAGVAKIIGGMSWEELGKAGAGLAGLGVIIAGLIAATKLAAKGGKHFNNIGKFMTKIATSMLMLAIVVKILGTMEWDELKKAGAGLAGLAVIVTCLITATKLAGNKINSAAKMISKIGFCMLLLAVTAKLVAGMSWDDMIKAGVGLAGLGAIVTGLIAATKLAGKDIDKVGGTILKISTAMLLLSVTAKIIAGMSWGEMAKAAIGLTALGAIVAGLVWATKLAPEKELARVTTTILAMSICIGILGIVATLLSLISLGGLAKGVIAVGLLGSIVALMVHATKGAEKCDKTIMKLSIAIGVMTVALIALSCVDPTKLAGATIALSTVMGMFALMTKSAGSVQKGMGTLIVLTVAVGILAGVIYLIAQLPTEAAIGSAIALSVLMAAMAVTLRIVSAAGTSAKNALTGVLGLLALAVPMLAFVGILALMQNIQNATTNAMALSALATVLSLLLIPLSLVGIMIGASGGMAMLGIVGLLAMAVPLVAFVGILALMQDIKNAEKNVSLLIALMTTLTVMLVAVSLIGPMALVGVQAVAAMTGLIIAIGALVVGIGALFEKFPMLEEFLDKGIPILQKLANGIGTVIGSFVSGVLTSATAGLPAVGANLSLFMTNAMPFIVGAQSIDAKMLEGVKSLAQTILILTGADILEGLTSWFTGGSSLADFGAEIAAFGPHLKAFADSVAGIDVASVQGAAAAAKTLAEMADTVPNEGGLAGWFAGENSLAAFGEEIVSLGKNIMAYSQAVVGLDCEAVTASATAAKALAEMANTVPNQGGMAAWFAGENSLAAFGTQIVSFGRSLKAYATEVTGIDAEAVTASTTAAKSLSDLANTVPNEGGVAAWFSGDNSIAAFGNRIVSFGASFAAYSAHMKMVDTGVVEATSAAAQSIVKLANSIPEDKLFKNETTLDEFGSQLSIFGGHFASYYKKISGIDASQLNSTITQLKRLISLAKSAVGLDTSGLSGFGAALTKLGKAGINGFIKAFTDATPRVRTAATNMANAFITAVKSKSTTMSTSFVSAVNKSLQAVQRRQTAFRDMGGKLMTGLLTGVKTKSGTLAKGMSDLVVKMAQKLMAGRQGFYSAGGFLVKGFAAGITENTWRAEARARAMAKAALEAAQKALKIKSPSRVARDEVGKYFVEGVAEGIDKDMSAEEAAAHKAQNIVSAFRNEFDKLDTSVKTAELEHELWTKTDGVTASEAEMSAAEAELLARKYELQTERVALAEGEYQETLKHLGETAEETRDAYNKLLQEQIDLVDLAAEIEGLKGVALSNTPEAFDAYAKYLKDNLEAMVEAGMTFKEMQQEASKASGWDYTRVAGYDESDVAEAADSIGEVFADKLDAGVLGGQGLLVKNMSSMVMSCTDDIKTHQPEWKDAGSYLVEGFAEGITDKVGLAEKASSGMAMSAYQSAVDALGIKSPSKAFFEIGKFADLGFAKGLTAYAGTAVSASTDVAEGALSGLKSMVSRLTNSINSEIDSQPSIRPVLDLTNIQNGASMLNGLFAQRTVALAASASMAVNNTNNMYDMLDQMQKIKDTRDSEIVGAISDLRGDFGSLIDAIENLSISLDGDTVVGKLIGKIDKTLGTIANHKGRGN